ncbi:unnamed protein product [Merluccius merluccius]
MQRTGGGTADMTPMSELDQRIGAIIGETALSEPTCNRTRTDRALLQQHIRTNSGPRLSTTMPDLGRSTTQSGTDSGDTGEDCLNTGNHITNT